MDRTIRTETPKIPVKINKSNESMPNLDLYGLQRSEEIYPLDDPRFDIAMFDDKSHKVEPMDTAQSG